MRLVAWRSGSLECTPTSQGREGQSICIPAGTADWRSSPSTRRDPRRLWPSPLGTGMLKPKSPTYSAPPHPCVSVSLKNVGCNEPRIVAAQPLKPIQPQSEYVPHLFFPFLTGTSDECPGIARPDHGRGPAIFLSVLSYPRSRRHDPHSHQSMSQLLCPQNLHGFTASSP